MSFFSGTKLRVEFEEKQRKCQLKIKEDKDKADKKEDKVYLFEQDQSITPLVIILLIPITFSHDHRYCKEKVGATSVGERKKKKVTSPD